MKYSHLIFELYSCLGKCLYFYRNYRIYQTYKKEGFLSKTIQWEGVPITFFYYKDISSRKKDLIFLHGFLDHSFTFRRMIPYLSDLKNQYNIYFIDLPGHGKSRLPYIRELWQVSSFARILYRFIYEYLKITYPVFISHSLGGVLVFYILQYAKERGDFPDQFQCSLFAIAPGILKMDAKTKENNINLFFPESLEDIHILFRNLFPGKTIEIPIFIKYFLLKRWKSDGNQYLFKNTFEIENKIFFTEDSLRGNPMPEKTYWIWGEKDTIIPVRYAKKLKKIVKNSRLLIIPDSGHSPHIDNPEILYQTIKKYL